MKYLIPFLLLSSSLYAGGDLTLNCKGWGPDQFEMSGELEESGSTYIDAFIDFKIVESGAVIHERKHIDTTGLYQLASIDSKQVYLAELRPLNTSEFQFLSIAANHPRPSGNSYLIYNNKQYFAECTVR
ncbi:MAG: hypothetical protein COW00_07045 [Bdellovibrio sp. CG12_big_fil_rev_8_21_14_0_65_39_13]|nr:MAG: hypothetical protein COW78_03170 [Bdellovibrio sp. CG22_combo_CG10-13_8_21_14_all_39_27]PIQ60356.1 MAG: hypothetical protein COW00_07045 [Bdellovibrio sp. CG12_big_fil_rev_8_21_14_0_65_39_13]PIR35035.1 MAG: hypothetical protein COV37_10415 [Bdellovibrio sp. CG11_big_fil_rev_8_21_14_0_20_39_38]PJB54253.1 MAG: hypothetical protein CO099_02575 [Bdellovibrio sp. CG_4_9_14_3_um_filter_39_7]